jgi:hypothetical protein
MGSLVIGAVLQSIGLILVTGMIAHVTMAAAIGRRLSLREAWAATRGQRWRLIGLTFLLSLLTMVLVGGFVLAWVLALFVLEGWQIFWFGLVASLAFAVLMLLFWVRVYYLSVPPLMLEDLRVLGAIRRGRQLTARAFWRVFGIALLTLLITQIGGALLGAPITLAAQAATSV